MRNSRSTYSMTIYSAILQGKNKSERHKCYHNNLEHLTISTSNCKALTSLLETSMKS